MLERMEAGASRVEKAEGRGTGGPAIRAAIGGVSRGPQRRKTSLRGRWQATSRESICDHARNTSVMKITHDALNGRMRESMS